MHLSLSWIREYVEIPKSITPQLLADLLNLHVVEVDEVVSQSEAFKNIIVGKISAIKPHPNADKLQLVSVDAGKKKQLDIVCGASNIKEGQLVPVALVGAHLSGDFEIKEAEIRGEKSSGMLCSEKELNLGSDHSGIMILDEKAKIGQDLSEHLDLNDHIYEIDNKSLTNRPDLWGYLGMAREIAIITDGKLKADLLIENQDNSAIAQAHKANPLNVKIETPESCSRYMATTIENIEILDSPQWLKKRLIASNLRPINNIVDITNYIMLETGQPMHAFDASLIINTNNESAEITVRNAKPEESIQLLDGDTATLSKNDLIITNSTSPIAIAGIIGGSNTEVSHDTTVIVLESANFDPISIRKTSSKISKRTESSIRFEKGPDPNTAEIAMVRAINLIKQILPNSTLKAAPIDITNFPQQMSIVKFSHEWIQKRIGIEVDAAKIVKILTDLGCKAESLKSGDIKVHAPSWRSKDISTKEDILEEVSRIIGYDNIKREMPSTTLSSPVENKEINLINQIKNVLTGLPALNEITNYSFVSKKHLVKCGIDSIEHIQLANPLNEEYTHLRKNLIPNLLTNIRTNQNSYEQIQIFEIGAIYTPVESDINKDNTSKEKLPYQENRVAIILASNNPKEDFDRIKSITNHLFEVLELKITYDQPPYLKEWCSSESSAAIISSGAELGYCSIIKQDVVKKLGLRKTPVICELRIPPMLEQISNKPAKLYKKESKFPKATRDLSFVLNSKISYNEIIEEISNFNPLIKSVDLFDVFTSENIGRNKKSMAFHIAYQSDRNLTNIEVDEIQNALIKKIESRFDATIRDF